ncbi:MAG: ATP-binding protein [Desulfovibrio sp.]|nr:ATP-binding protein [Desulfovibrio sp.]
MDTQWEHIVAKLASTLESGVMKVWILPLEASYADGVLTLLAPKPYMAGWISRELLPTISRCAKEVLGEDLVVHIDVKPEPTRAQKTRKPLVREEVDAPRREKFVSNPRAFENCFPFLAPSKCPLPKRTWRYSFSDFVVGDSNRMAVAAAKDVCREHGDVQTLYLNSPSGLGKTHLTQAVGQSLSDQAITGQRVGYVTADEFSTRYIASIKTNEVEAFKQSMRTLDVLLFEDVHFLQNKPKTQETVLSIVKGIQEQGGRVVFTSSFSPRELQKVDSQLVSSFCSGILTHIDRPDVDMRVEICRRKAQSLHVKLSDAVCLLLAQHLDGDVRQIESCVNSLLFKANLFGGEVTEELALEVLREYGGGIEGPDLANLSRIVCEYLGVDPASLQTRSRCQTYVFGRNTIFYLARKHTDLTLQEIGTHFNRRHSTVLQGITQVEKEIARSSTQGRQLQRIMGMVEERMGLTRT